MAYVQKTDFVFRRNGRVHLNWRGRQFSRLLAAEVCASAVVMLDTPSSEVVWRVLATHSICQFPLHFPSRASPCAITFQLDSTRKRTTSHPTRLTLSLTSLREPEIWRALVCRTMHWQASSPHHYCLQEVWRTVLAMAARCERTSHSHGLLLFAFFRTVTNRIGI